MRGKWAVLLWLSCPGVQAAEFSASSRGTSSGEFLRLGVGARAAAMGEAYSAVADEASALYWNPAGLAQIPGGSLTLMHAPYVASSFYDYAAFAQSLGSFGCLGIGGQFLSLGAVPQTDAVGNDLGSFNPNDMAISVGYARLVGDGSVGVTAKFIRSTLLATAQTEAADVGFLSPGMMEDRLRLAATVTNLGGQLKFEQEGAPLPMVARAGGRFRFSERLLVSLDGAFPRDDGPYAALGGEYILPFPGGVKGALRGGYNTRTVSGLGGLSGISFGLGLMFPKISMDYAFLPMGSLGATHRLSLSLRWGRAEEAHRLADAVAAPERHVEEARDPRRVIFQYVNAGAKAVEIAGSFNRWTLEPMSRNAQGVWVLSKDLPYGIYNYKLLVDGREITNASGSSREISEYSVGARDDTRNQFEIR